MDRREMLKVFTAALGLSGVTATAKAVEIDSKPPQKDRLKFNGYIDVEHYGGFIVGWNDWQPFDNYADNIHKRVLAGRWKAILESGEPLPLEKLKSICNRARELAKMRGKIVPTRGELTLIHPWGCEVFCYPPPEVKSMEDLTSELRTRKIAGSFAITDFIDLYHS